MSALQRQAELGSHGHTYGDTTVHGGNVHLGDQHYHLPLPENISIVDHHAKLLDSLRYDDINTRVNSIADAEFRTFSWLLGDDLLGGENDHMSDSGRESYDDDRNDSKLRSTENNSEGPDNEDAGGDSNHRPLDTKNQDKEDEIATRKREARDSFVSWLQSGQGIYLIQGKAGSGKSTLMKFIADHPRTKELLPQAQSSRKPLVVSHYFWLAGSNLQRSYKGFLASLTHQLLVQATYVQNKQALQQANLYTKRAFQDWSEKELFNLLLACFQNIHTTLLLMVDALDEFDQDDNCLRLLSCLDQFKKHENVKICVSSRPTSWLDHRFHGCEQLRLQDLTSADIRAYAQGILEKDFTLYSLESPNIDDLLRLICEKAEGVFLWVCYALHAISQGLDALDDTETLEQRLLDLPTGMEELYRHMWLRHQQGNKKHIAESARYLLCGQILPLDLFNFMIIVNGECRQKYLSDLEPLKEDVLEAKLQAMAKKLMVRTAGLFHCQRDTRRVGYLHRTVHDFLWETEFGISLVHRHEGDLKELYRNQIHANIAHILQFGLKESVESNDNLSLIKRSCNIVVHNLGQDIEVMTNIDETMCRMVSKKFGGMIVHNWLAKLLSQKDLSNVIDFAGLAAIHGAFEYVKLLLQKTAYSSNYKTYIMRCALIASNNHRKLPEAIKFILWLMETGVDLLVPATDYIPIRGFTLSSIGVLFADLLDLFCYLTQSHSYSEESNEVRDSQFKEKLKLMSHFLSHTPASTTVASAVFCSIICLQYDPVNPALCEHRGCHTTISNAITLDPVMEGIRHGGGETSSIIFAEVYVHQAVRAMKLQVGSIDREEKM